MQGFHLISLPLRRQLIFLVISETQNLQYKFLTFKAISFTIELDLIGQSCFFFVNISERYWHVIHLYHQQSGVFSSVLLINLSHLCI